MFRVARRVDNDIEYPMAVRLTFAENREQILEFRGVKTVICVH